MWYGQHLNQAGYLIVDLYDDGGGDDDAVEFCGLGHDDGGGDGQYLYHFDHYFSVDDQVDCHHDDDGDDDGVDHCSCVDDDGGGDDELLQQG